MLRSAFLVLLLSFSVLAQINSKNENAVMLANIKSEYKSLSDIAPIVVNNANKKIYSYTVGWGLQLLEFDEAAGKWKRVIFGIRCGNSLPSVYAEAEKPILAKSSFPIFINVIARREGTRKSFQLTNPKKYKLLFEYAYEPWLTPFNPKLTPEQTFSVESPEFLITLE